MVQHPKGSAVALQAGGASAEAEWIRRAGVGVVHCRGAAPAVLPLRSALLHASSPGVWQAANGRRRISGTRVQCVSAGSSLRRDGPVQTHTAPLQHWPTLNSPT